MASSGLSCPVGAGGDQEADEGCLDALIEASRSPEGRSRLAPRLPAVLRRLRPGLPLSLLIPTLRLLRNLCAGEATGQAAFLEASGPVTVASVVLGAAIPVDVSRVGLQLLGNVVAAGEKEQRDVWNTLFPEGMLELARVRDAGACDALCMVLRSCCCSPRDESVGRLEELCSGERGLPILKEVLATACSDEYRGDWLKLLLCRICFEGPYLSPLFSMSGPFEFSNVQKEVNYEDQHFAKEQAFLLGLLSEILSEQFFRGTISRDFALSILQVLKAAATAVDFTSRGTSPLPTGSPATDVLGHSLTILRDMCASDGSDELVDFLVSSGLCRLLLALLRDLEPPWVIRRTLSQRASKDPPSPSPRSSKVCPYRGFRRDVVAVIGNCACGRKRVQDEIRQQDGIFLLLQQCVVDEDNPYLREWGMLTVGYLLEGNAENQRLVAELELQEPIDTPEIADLGLTVDVDKRTGRVKLVNV